MIGRETKLTSDLQQKLCAAIAAGNYYRPACKSVNLGYQTFRTWMKRGVEEEEGIYRDFRDAIVKAEADAELAVVALWQAQIPNNWAAARDFLARRFAARWGPDKSLLREVAKDVKELKGGTNG